MDAVETLSDITGQFWLADIIKACLVVDGASLMEFSEKNVKVNNGSAVDHELVPVSASWHHFVIGLELRDDLLEVPWEGEHVSMLLLTKNEVSSNSLALCLDASLFLLRNALRGLHRRC